MSKTYTLFGTASPGPSVAMNNTCYIRRTVGGKTWTIQCFDGIMTVNGEERLRNVSVVCAHDNRVEATLEDGTKQTVYYVKDVVFVEEKPEKPKEKLQGVTKKKQRKPKATTTTVIYQTFGNNSIAHHSGGTLNIS